MTVAGQTAVSYTYDNANRLTAVTQGTASVGLTYDDADRRTALTLPNGTSTEYTYDNGSRLTGLTYKAGSTTLGTLTYAYDAAGTRTTAGGTWARTGQPAAVTSATYNAANHQVTFGGATLTYDLNGNLTSDGTNTYTWNARNQLMGITGGTSFIYDGAGRRQAKTVGGATTSFLHDGLNPVQEQNGSALVNLLTGLGIDEYYVRTDSSGSQTFWTDALGSTVALTDGTPAVAASYTYEAFGATGVTGTTSNGYDYTGRESDGTALKYYRARYHHTGLARFVSEDPIGFDGGDINLYAYAANAPVDFTDPSGMSLVGNAIPGYCAHPSLIPVTPELSGRKGVIAQTVAAERAFLALVGRALDCSIVGTPPTVASSAGGAAARGLGANPFKGKTAQDVADVLTRRGYVPKGPDPVAGFGTFVNPKTGRGYHINASHAPPKGPHVGVHRPRDIRDRMDPRDYPMGGP
jgi:RHS repeat-associated protein